ncbi:MAG: hypothetical protein QOK14_1676 [Frankiaceae bacterium]|jgi:predicted dehydrogenase|nr:hypothetical protein [Frankiaceae bacterium]
MTDENVRWGFLGAGGIATGALGPAVAAARNATLHAVAARDLGRAQGLADRFGGKVAYASYDELLADPDVDAVYVSLSNDNHMPWSLKALAAGKHVLCEKPLGMTAPEVEQMIAAATAAGRILMEASWYRWHPRTQAAELLVADGAIGAVRTVESVFAIGGVAPGNYRHEPARGGGAFYDVGCYPVSAAVWAFGGAEPDRVEARIVDSPAGVDLVTDATLHFAGGTAHVYGGMDEPERQSLVITGDGGSIEFDAPALTANKSAPAELIVTTASGTERIEFPAADPYQLMAEAMSDAIAGRPAWLLPLSQSLTVARIIDDVFAAGRS